MNLKICEVSQELEYLSEDQIKSAIQSQTCIEQWAYILHDKDVNEKGEPIRPHWHVMLKFNDSRSTKYIAKWFNVEEQYIQKCKTKWKNMIQYLTHDNAANKYSYDRSEVKSNFDTLEVVNSVIDDDRLREIIGLIDKEVMKEYNIDSYVTCEEYIKYKTPIRNAMEYIHSRKMKEGDRNMEVIFISGASGTGKSTYAKQICEQKNYSYYISSGGRNPLDDYKGQDCVILDDLRASDYKYNELLKMLDNNTNSSVGCRYYNKSMCWCKLIIITSVLPLDVWYKNLQEYESEPLLQLKRRCKTLINMDVEMSIYMFDFSLKDYILVSKMINPVLSKYNQYRLNENERLDFLKELLGDSSLSLVKEEYVESEHNPFTQQILDNCEVKNGRKM